MSDLKLKLHRLFHWEYWAMPFVYYPIMPVWFYFALRAKSFFFFNAANPSIKNGGMAMESKKDIYDLIPPEYIPETVSFYYDTPLDVVLSMAAIHQINFPFIIKPDIGLKGLGVQIVKNEFELAEYLKKSTDNFLIQQLIKFPFEVGIFYCRIPGESKGKITGIVYKDFLTVTGNDKDAILQLIKQNPRSHFQLPALKKMYGKFLNTILPKGETFVLVPYGSHTRGTQFIDITHKSNDKLLNTIDTLCKKVDGFYYGRLDIMYSSWEELCEGKYFSIIELNGAGSEPTHIYDPSHSLFFAWKEIIKHWKLLYKISTINFSKGHSYLSFNAGREMIKANSKLEEKLKAF